MTPSYNENVYNPFWSGPVGNELIIMESTSISMNCFKIVL